MYRNIYYNNRKGTIDLFTWNDKGDRTQNEYPFKPYLYVESQNSKDGLSIYNTPLRKIEFKNQYERNKFVQESGIKRLFHNVKVEQQFLLEQFSSISTSPEFSQHPLRVFYCDIEVYSPDEFPEASQAKHPINALTIYDTLTEMYYTWGLKNSYKSNAENVIYEKCETETQLLRKFLTFWTKNCPDILSGWNIAMFDVPYIINRCNNILEEHEVLQLSPVGQLYKREGVVQRFGKMEDKWYIKGISILDYMDVYKTFSPQQLESYSLDYVAEHELGEKKLEFEAANHAQLANEDWNTFIDYNIRDVEILVKLDGKLKFIDVVRMMAYLGLTSFEDALGTISVVTGAMSVKAEEKGMRIATFHTSTTPNYEGGYVKEPDRGLKEAIISYDANSLYPNTIITLNLSPETKMGKILNVTDTDVEFKLVTGKEYTLPLRKFAEFIKEENIAVTKARCLFSQKTKGLCPELVDGIYKQRVEVQSKLKETEKSLTKDEKELVTLKELYNLP